MSRRKTTLVAIAALAGLLVPHDSGARVNPLNVMTGGGVRTPRAEIIIVIDVSGKMVEPTGGDCSGTQPGMDVCGDGICTGVETAKNSDPVCGAPPLLDECRCLSDCLEGNAAAHRPPNTAKNCEMSTQNKGPGRLFMIKRAMRNVIPEFRTVASFALDTFPRHYGYYAYAKSSPPAGSIPWDKWGWVTIFLHELELKHGRWIKDATGASAWDATTDQPVTSFMLPGWTALPYYRLDQAVAMGLPVKKVGPVPDPGDTKITGKAHVYRREQDGAYHDQRFDWRGRQFSDGTYNWEYVGSYYTFPQFEVVDYWANDISSPGGYLTNVPLNAQFYDVLAAGRYKGPSFPDATGSFWVYHKFRYNDPILREDPVSPLPAEGFVWPDLHLEPSRYQAAHDAKQGILMQWLNRADNGGASTNSTANRAPAWDAITKAKNHFLERIEGTGPFACPVAPAPVVCAVPPCPIAPAGVCPDGLPCDGAGKCPDKVADCRNRFVIFLTDGKHQGDHPKLAIKDLWDQSKARTGMPIPTFVIGMFPEDQGSVDESADMGNDGQADNDTVALTGEDEAELTVALRTTLLNALKGDFTTAAPGVTTISSGAGGTVIVDNVTLLPSTEFPGWKGHVRAVDLAQTPAQVLWDAGLQLQGRDWKNRMIFSGPDSSWAGGAPVNPILLVAPDGTVNLDGSDTAKFGPGGKGIKHIWPKNIPCAAVPPVCPYGTLCGGSGGFAAGRCMPSDADLLGMVRWVAGQNRPEDWKLGPVVASVPATVGPPPKYAGVSDGTVDHSTYEANRADRPRLTYVLSNEGGMHAFRTDSGTELFFYLVPEALWGVFEVFRQGGQDPDPRNFKYVLASSVRVEDVPDPTKADGFVTEVVLTMGPGGRSSLVLDVTQPIDCSTCGMNNPPFMVVGSTNSVNVSAQGFGWAHGDPFPASPLRSYLGETWSIPSVFYDYAGGQLKAHYAFGSGYYPGAPDFSPPHNDEFYFYLDASTAPPTGKAMHLKMDATTSTLPCARVLGQPGQCHTGVLANAIAVVDEANKREVLASYQVDLAGRLVRFPKGVPDIVGPAPGTTNVKELLGPDINYTGSLKDYPLYFPPAAYYEPGTGKVILALNTHAYTEDQWDIDPTTPLPKPPAISRIGMLVDDGGAVVDSKYCAINDICACLPPVLPAACPLKCQPKADGSCPAGCAPDGSGGCNALAGPTADALPTSQPLLLQNASAGNRMEAFFLYYDPPPYIMDSCGARVGDTWSVRMVYDVGAATWALAEAKKVPSTYGSGLTIVGRGKDLGLALTGIGEGAQAQVATYSGGAIGAGMGSGKVVAEGLREVN